MPLFRLLGARGGPEAQRVAKKKQRPGRCRKTDEDGSVPSLTQLCLLSLADNMKDVWVKDYADNYLDQYSFRYIMGPFNLLPGKLVEELTGLLCARKQLSRAALHLLLVPQIRGLSLDLCPGLVTPVVCSHITARCQGLWSLDLSGAQQLSSKVLSETLGCLPALRSLSLAGVHCDRCVVRTIAQRCRFLRHLDVSRCHFLSPAALLPLGGGDFCSSSASPSSSFRCNSTSQSPISSLTSDPNSSFSAPLSPLPLRSLLALDIGFGEQDGDRVAAAAYLLLSLQELERVAMEGIAQACALIEHREFSQTDEFTDREGVPSMNEVWRHRQGMDRERREGTAAVDEEHEDEEEEEEAERMLWEACEDESEEDASRDEGPSCSLNQTEEKVRALSQSDDEHLILHLKDIRGLTCDFLDSVGRLCPDIHSISVNADDQEHIRRRSQESLLAAGLQTWSGQLQSLSVNFLGPLGDLLPALQVAGSSLLSLSLEGVKTSPHTPLLEAIKACPRLRNLLISADPPTMRQQEEDQVDEDLPQLPYLSSLTLNFSYDHSQMMPAMSWMSLRKGLKCLLTGSPLLEKLSLVSLPCPLNSIIRHVLRVGNGDRCLPADSTDLHLMPLGRLQHIELLRTNVDITTVESIIQRSKRLKFVDLSYCWKIKQTEWMHCKRRNKVEIVWM